MVCKSCGKENKVESLVCESCGANLKEQAPVTQNTEEPASTTNPDEQKSDAATPVQAPEAKPAEETPSTDTQNTDSKPEVAAAATGASSVSSTEGATATENKQENTTTEKTTTTDTAGAPVVVNEKKSSKYLVIGAVIAILLMSVLAAIFLMQTSKSPQPEQPVPTKEPAPTALIPTRIEEIPQTTAIPSSAAGPTKGPSAFNTQSAAALTQMMTSGNPDTFKQAFASPENVPTDQDAIKAFQTIGNFEFDPTTFKEGDNGTATIDATLKVPGTDMKQAMEVTLTNVNGEWKIALMTPKR